MMPWGLCSRRERGDLLHVDPVVVLADHVLRRLSNQQPEPRHGRAMRQMAAGRKVETHEGVARLQQREERGLIGLRNRNWAARMAETPAKPACLAHWNGQISTAMWALFPSASEHANTVAFAIFVGAATSPASNRHQTVEPWPPPPPPLSTLSICSHAQLWLTIILTIMSSKHYNPRLDH